MQIGEEGGHLITTANGGDYIQDGDGNYINAWQEGDSNIAKFNQYGDDHSIETVQNGSNNSATVFQSSY